MPYRREAEVVLAAWREADKVLSTAEPGGEAYEQARADFDRCREEYRRLTAEAIRTHRPLPATPPDELMND
jgi:hypothetical protein